jgi:hypothetical protein
MIHFRLQNHLQSRPLLIRRRNLCLKILGLLVKLLNLLSTYNPLPYPMRVQQSGFHFQKWVQPVVSKTLKKSALFNWDSCGWKKESLLCNKSERVMMIREIPSRPETLRREAQILGSLAELSHWKTQREVRAQKRKPRIPIFHRWVLGIKDTRPIRIRVWLRASHDCWSPLWQWNWESYNMIKNKWNGNLNMRGHWASQNNCKILWNRNRKNSKFKCFQGIIKRLRQLYLTLL